MENKKINVFKLVNLVFLIAVLVLCGIALFVKASRGSLFDEFNLDILNIFVSMMTVITGLMYFLLDYKKEGANFYNIFMRLFVVSNSVFAMDTMMSSGTTFVKSILLVLPIVASTIMAVGKDLGKVKTFIFAGLLLISKFVLLAEDLINYSSNNIDGFKIIANSITCFYIAILVCFLVVAKYNDKKKRGSK